MALRLEYIYTPFLRRASVQLCFSVAQRDISQLEQEGCQHQERAGSRAGVREEEEALLVVSQVG